MPIPLESVVQHLTDRNEAFPLPAEDLKRNVTMRGRSGRKLNVAGLGFRLRDNVEVSLVGGSNGHTVLAIRQRREPETLEDAVRARIQSMGKRFAQGPRKS